MAMTVFGVDFDGTLCESEWPGIGAPNLALIEWCKEQQQAGNKIILWTCRTARRLEDAVEFLNGFGLVPDSVNENLPEMIEKYGTNPRKVFMHCYIGDECADKKKYGLPYHATAEQVTLPPVKKKKQIDTTPQTVRIV